MVSIRSSRSWASIIAFLIVAYGTMLVAVPAFAQETPAPSGSQQSDVEDNCEKGKMDGRMDSKGSPIWFLAGFGCGIIGFAAAAFAKPGVPPDAIMGHSPEYTACYVTAYQNSSRNKNIGYSCAGWLVAIPIVLAIQSSSS